MKKNGTIALLLAVALAIGSAACKNDETVTSATTATTATTETTMTTASEAPAPMPSSVPPATNTSVFATSTVVPGAAPERPSVTTVSDKALATAPRIDVAEAKRLIDAGASIVDVRTPDAFASGHLPGAINMPFATVQAQMASLPKGKPIVVYCACPAEESSGGAAQIMAFGGLQAKALRGGVQAWRAAGHPIITGAQ